MQWEIIYEVEGTKETWGKDNTPGRLYIPEPRTPKEVADAVQSIIKDWNPAKITIRSLP